MNRLIFIITYFIVANCFAEISSDLFQENRYEVKRDDIIFSSASKIKGIEELLGKLDKINWKKPDSLNFGYGAGPKWLKVRINNIHSGLTFKYLFPMMQEVEIYQVQNNVILKKIIAGKKNQNSAYRGALLTTSVKGIFDIYLYLNSTGATQVPITIERYESSWESIQKEYLLLGAWLGMALGLMLFYLIIYFQLKDEMYLYYFLYGFSLMIINSSFSGLFYQYLWFTPEYIKSRLVIVSIGLMLIFLLLFSQKFLQLKKYFSSRTNILIKVLLFLSVVLTLINLSFYNTVSIALTGLLGVMIPATLLVLSFYLTFILKEGSVLYIFATGSVLTGFILYCLKDFSILPHNYITERSLFYCSSIEMLLLAVALANRFKNIQSKYQSYLRSIVDKKVLERMAMQARQVAHDIISPLAALTSTYKNNKIKFPQEERLIAEQSLERMSDIISKLENASEQSGHSIDNKEILYPLIKRIVAEKRIEYKDNPNIKFIIKNHLDFGTFTEINKSDFIRSMSNLINNSIEAKKESEDLILKIELRNNFSNCFINIVDNGIGIKENNLGTIFQQGVSLNKKEGKGIGLSEAKKYFESTGGSLVIDSRWGYGTNLQITIKNVPSPSWFAESINYSNQKICIIDDDHSTHLMWRKKFKLAKNKIQGVYSSIEFETWYLKNKTDNYFYLFDYELLGSSESGLDLIEKYNLGNQSILATSYYNDISIQKRCINIKLKIIPKELIESIPLIKNLAVIDSDKPALVLIDNDPITRGNWRILAQKSNINFFSYSSIEEFIDDSDQINLKSRIYVDSNLSNEIKGEVESERIYNLGYENIYLTTGMKVEILPAWIIGQQNKDFPDIIPLT